MLENLGELLGSKKDPMEVLTDLLEKENIELKTHLTIEQIKVLIQLKWHSLIYKKENLDKDPMELLTEVLDYYLQLKVSLNREGRKEIIKGITEVREKFLESSLIEDRLSPKKLK